MRQFVEVDRRMDKKVERTGQRQIFVLRPIILVLRSWQFVDCWMFGPWLHYSIKYRGMSGPSLHYSMRSCIQFVFRWSLRMLDYKNMSLKSEWKRKLVAGQAGEYLKGCGRTD